MTGSRPCNKPRGGQAHDPYLVTPMDLTHPIIVLKCPSRVSQMAKDTGLYVQVLPGDFRTGVGLSQTSRPPRPSSRR